MAISQDTIHIINNDIVKSQALLSSYSYDIDQMSRLFHYLMSTYKDVIDDFCTNLRITQPFDSPVDQANVYNDNVSLLINRLIGFRENNYENNGLMEYYLHKEYENIPLDISFHDLRMSIGMMNTIPPFEKQEIIEKIGEIEEICSKVAFKKEKWELLRQYVVWLSGKHVDVAMKILPVFLKINHK